MLRFTILFIILCLCIISLLCYIKKNKESFYIDDDNKYTTEEEEVKSSGLIGKDGVLPVYPHCNDVISADNPNPTFPDCCDEQSLKDGNCHRLFPKFMVYKKDASSFNGSNPDGKWSAESNKDIRDDTKYTYHPLFPYSRKMSKENSHIVNEISDLLADPGSIRDVPKLIKGGFIPLKNPVEEEDENIIENNLNILKNYGENIFAGKCDENECTVDEIRNHKCETSCKPIGNNRWEKIGVCPNDPKQDLYAYIDVQTKNSSLNSDIPKLLQNGLTEGIIKDIYSLNPIRLVENVYNVIEKPLMCQPNNKKQQYIPFMGDTYKD